MASTAGNTASQPSVVKTKSQNLRGDDQDDSQPTIRRVRPRTLSTPNRAIKDAKTG